jgi:S-adenosylmethionine synthetase
MKLITSEAVSIGHPDKVADQISDAMLDECLKQDGNSRVAVETMVTTNTVFLAGEVTTHADVDVDNLVRGVVKDIGYDFNGFDYNNLTISRHIHRQSPDIAMGVDRDGAGDQGMMFGYAEGDATTNYLPIPIYYSQALMKELQYRRENCDWGMRNLRPDAKCQITYDEDSGRIRTIVISHQHNESMSNDEFRLEAIDAIMDAIPARLLMPLEFLTADDTYSLLEAKTFVFLNPTGRFVEGGPSADTGLTGRKIVVDTYGGVGKIGGGAFSGKDPSKVDRSAAYMCRYVAKNLVASGKCGKAEVSVAYAIGVAEPVQISVNTFGTGYDAQLTEYVKKNYDFRPKAIIEKLGLRKPNGWCYRDTAKNGHFTNCSFPWEKIEK